MYREPRDKRKLQRSPLVVVLTEVRFAPILKIGTLIPAIQEELRRRGFPAFTASVLNQFQLVMGGEPSLQATSRWTFASKDSSQSATLTTEGLSLHTTAYDDFEAFLDTLREVVEVVATIAEPSYADRIGLRYVDAVPDVGDDLRMYFNDTVLTFTAQELGVESLLSSQHIVAKTPAGHLQIRMTQVEDSPLLPPDLLTPELASLGSQRPGVHALLDIDSTDDSRSDFSWSAIEDRLWGAHAHASTAFWKAITDSARAKWGEADVAS